MKDLEFEFVHRWAAMGERFVEAIRTGDDERAREFLALLEERDRALEDYLPGGGPTVAGRWFLDDLTIDTVAPNNNFIMSEDFATGIGLTNSDFSILIPSDGIYHVVGRCYVEIDAVDAGTAAMGIDIFNFGDGTPSDGEAFTDSLFLEKPQVVGFGYLKWANIVQLTEGATISPYTRMMTSIQAAGDGWIAGGSSVGVSSISVAKIA